MQQQPQLAPTYEKCPTHPINDIVLFCLNDECKEPLCKECCKLHIQQHNQQGTPAIIDTVDSVREMLFNDVHNLKIKFEEEREILHHFSDGEHSQLIKSIHGKIEQVKKNLHQLINDYCDQLEKEVQKRIHQHKAAHPGEKKELHHKLNTVINSLDQQEKGLQSQKYIKSCLILLFEKKDHDLEGLSLDIDNALKHYLQNMFDICIHNDKFDKINDVLREYVEIHQVNLGEELENYTQQIRENKKIQGIQQQQYQNKQQQQYQNQQQFQQSIKKQELNPIISQTIPQTKQNYQSIYDIPHNQLNIHSSLQQSRLGSNSKNYENRLQQNNEKLKQYYG
ncbi:unnamed protein product [Paramecium primaurelia]|uniref:B box-type domain-containing protein n=1 Tax=Paramecium primaurelia TaxID=5886 RepID=A0A8S1N4U2_PARPR|nr:unnamed protein product [Paramecium primaurelia]